MVFMLQSSWRQPVGKIIEPVARALIKARVSANLISVIGGLGASFCAIYFFPKGEFLVGALAVTLFVLFDLFDGTVARLSATGTTKWGAALDSTLDRISDSAILIGGFIYVEKNNDSLSKFFLIALVSSFLVSYIKARAESLGIKCDGGIAERSERLIIILVAYALFDLGIDWALQFGIYLLAGLSIITVIQRLVIVYQESK